LTGAVPVDGEYSPSPAQRSADQVALYEGSGGTRGTTLRGYPVIVLTTRGNRTGKVRKTPLMRVEHQGRYAVVASQGGAPTHPVWYHNVVADPHVTLQDGPVARDYVAHEAHDEEKSEWWGHAVAAYPDYAAYQQRTEREIPLFVLEPVDTGADGTA
jgi:F420H(2)-dependent quinone reductase